MHHGAGGLEELGFADVMAGLFLLDGADDVLAEFGVCGAGFHAGVEIVLGLREEAGADFAVGGEADPAAGAAEGVGDGSYDAEFGWVVGEGVATGCFAGVLRLEREDGVDGGDAGEDFALADDNFRRPEAVFFERHEFDEADYDVF